MVDFWIEPPGGARERIRKLAPVATKRAAIEYERALRDSLALGVPARKEVLTLAAFSDEFLRNYAATSNRPGEQDQKRRNLNLYLLPAMGKLGLDEIDRRVIDAFKAMQLGKGLHPNTVNHQLATLSRALRMAVEWGHLDHAPKVAFLKLPPQKFDFFTFEEAEQLLAGAKGMDRTVVLALLRTGLRAGELVALRWEDVDLAGRKLIVRRSMWEKIEGPPKSGRIREVPIASDLAAALEAHRRRGHQYVFAHLGGKSLSRHNLVTIVARACRKAGLREVGPHVFRHTFGSHLIMRGVPLKVVQELLGHADVRMTLRYAHLAPVAHRDAVEVLARPHDQRSLGTIWAPRVNEGEAPN